MSSRASMPLRIVPCQGLNADALTGGGILESGFGGLTVMLREYNLDRGQAG
jgi:hypothetical protein